LSRLWHVLDRALSRLVPEIVASACIPPENWREYEYWDCTYGCIAYGRYRDCHSNCNGIAVCGSWVTLWI
jgi:hypothetical protein